MTEEKRGGGTGSEFHKPFCSAADPIPPPLNRRWDYNISIVRHSFVLRRVLYLCGFDGQNRMGSLLIHCPRIIIEESKPTQIAARAYLVSPIVG